MRLVFITSPAAANETQVVESGHLVLDGGRGVTEFGGVVLIISRHDGYQGAVWDVAQGDHLTTRRRDVLLNCATESPTRDGRLVGGGCQTCRPTAPTCCVMQI